MSTIQPQMNTASFASLAGSPMASAGEAPQGLDFLTILAGSQASDGAAQSAPVKLDADLTQALQIAGGNVAGSQTGKFLPVPAKALAAAAVAPLLEGRNQPSANAATNVDPAQMPATKALIAHGEATPAKLSKIEDGGEGSLDILAQGSIADGLVPMQIAPEANLASITRFDNDVTAHLAGRSVSPETDDASADGMPPRATPGFIAMGKAASARPGTIGTAPMPAELMPFVAEATAQKSQAGNAQIATAQSGAPVTSRGAAQAGLANGTANFISAPGEPSIDNAVRGASAPAIAPAPIDFARTMAAAPAVPAATLIAARVAESAKPDATGDLAAPAPVAASASLVGIEAQRDASSDIEAPARLALAQTATLDVSTTSTVFQPASLTPEAGGARAITGAVSAQSEAIQPQDFDTLVGRLTEAREAASPNLVRAAINHAELGHISLAFRADDARFSVTMTGSDPALAPAVLAATSAAQAAGNEAQAREQAAQNQQQAQQNGQQQNSQQQAQSQLSGSGPQPGSGNAAQDQADRQATDWRQTSGEGRNQAGTSSGDTTTEAHTAPRSTPSGIYA